MTLIAPTEPSQLVAIGKSSSVPETFGADILIPTSVAGLIGVQRKVFPGDFIASLYDGRLATSLGKLTELPVRILLLEGRPAWTFDGALTGFEYSQRPFYQSTLRSLLWSAQVQLGVSSYWSSGISDTLDFVRDLKRWGDSEHSVLFKRPNIEGDVWRKRVTPRDRASWILQGFDGIGPETAGAIVDHFGGLPFESRVTIDELLEVPGVGRGRAEKILKTLERLGVEVLGSAL